MSNRNIIHSSAVASTLAMRANSPVFSTEGRPHNHRNEGISERSNYPTYPTNLKSYLPSADRALQFIESATPSQPINATGNDRLMNARQVAAKLGVSERWVRDHTTRRSPRIRGLKMGSLMRYRLTDVEAFIAELDTQPSSRPSRFRV